MSEKDTYFIDCMLGAAGVFLALVGQTKAAIGCILVAVAVTGIFINTLQSEESGDE